MAAGAGNARRASWIGRWATRGSADRAREEDASGPVEPGLTRWDEVEGRGSRVWLEVGDDDRRAIDAIADSKVPERTAVREPVAGRRGDLPPVSQHEMDDAMSRRHGRRADTEHGARDPV